MTHLKAYLCLGYSYKNVVDRRLLYVLRAAYFAIYIRPLCILDYVRWCLVVTYVRDCGVLVTANVIFRNVFTVELYDNTVSHST